MLVRLTSLALFSGNCLKHCRIGFSCSIPPSKSGPSCSLPGGSHVSLAGHSYCTLSQFLGTSCRPLDDDMIPPVSFLLFMLLLLLGVATYMHALKCLFFYGWVTTAWVHCCCSFLRSWLQFFLSSCSLGYQGHWCEFAPGFRLLQSYQQSSWLNSLLISRVRMNWSLAQMCLNCSMGPAPHPPAHWQGIWSHTPSTPPVTPWLCGSQWPQWLRRLGLSYWGCASLFLIISSIPPCSLSMIANIAGSWLPLLWAPRWAFLSWESLASSCCSSCSLQSSMFNTQIT